MPGTPRSPGGQLDGIILAFDFGLRRIGVAAGNRVTQSATPVTTLKTRAGRPPWHEIDRLIADWQPLLLVVGEPDPVTSAAVAAAATAFSAALTERYGLPVERVDETLTSAAAASQLREARRAGHRPRAVGRETIDSNAARLIAEQFLASG